MNRIVLGAVALIAAGWTASAQAADLSYGSPAPYTVNPAAQHAIAGPAPISAAISAMPGARSTTIRPSRRVSRAASRPATIGRRVPWVFGVEGDIQATGADDTFAPWKFSNPWFGTVRGRVGYAFKQHFVLRHRRSGVRRIARRDIRPVGIPYQRGLDRGRRRRIRLRPDWSAKIEYLYVDLAEQPLHHHRRVERLPVRTGARRRELSLLIATRKHVATSRPRRGRIFCLQRYRAARFAENASRASLF